MVFHCHRRLNNNVHFPGFNYNYKIQLQFTTHHNINLTVLCREGLLKEALHILLATHKPPVESSAYLQLLQTCIAKHVLSQGKQIHSLITNGGFAFATDTFYHNNLINMYVKCGSLVDARQVFDDMEDLDCFSWNTIIAAYRRNGYPHQALILFQQMQRAAVQPDQFTFASILEACADTNALMDVHALFQSAYFGTDWKDARKSCGVWLYTCRLHLLETF